jgi:membrane protein implicated in regulation of membrane protease activity
MDAWVVWFIVGCVLAVGEMVSMGFYLAPFAAGAFIAALLALVGVGTALAWGVFIVVSLIALTVARPIARSHRKMPPQIRTGTAALVGKTGVVLERIANQEAVGCVRIDGEVWTARSYDEDEVIEPGVRVQIVEIRGATALVSE